MQINTPRSKGLPARARHGRLDGQTVLFPPEVPAIDIFFHPITRGRSGELIGA